MLFFDKLLQTTRIVSFLATNSNLVMKSTIKYVHSFSGTSFTINLSTSMFVLFFIFWYILQLFTYFSTSLVTLATSSFLLSTMSSSIFLYILLLVYYGVTKLSLPSVPHPSIHIIFLLSTSNLLPSAIHFLLVLFLIYLPQVLLLLLLLNYESIIIMFGFCCSFLLLLSSPVFY